MVAEVGKSTWLFHGTLGGIAVGWLFGLPHLLTHNFFFLKLNISTRDRI